MQYFCNQNYGLFQKFFSGEGCEFITSFYAFANLISRITAPFPLYLFFNMIQLLNMFSICNPLLASYIFSLNVRKYLKTARRSFKNSNVSTLVNFPPTDKRMKRDDVNYSFVVVTLLVYYQYFPGVISSYFQGNQKGLN